MQLNRIESQLLMVLCRHFKVSWLYPAGQLSSVCLHAHRSVITLGVRALISWFRMSDLFGCVPGRFEPCWPAIMKGAQAVVIVFDPHNRAHETEVELW